ncbi:hypothetical protein CRENBAI_020209 [Crenichthys baileyi]|uniref:Uncharacterized protein n=1 Tax=Crenichthys baileyi TaxID=28760 RepID=A0AAV9SH20_9TELE
MLQGAAGGEAEQSASSLAVCWKESNTPERSPPEWVEHDHYIHQRGALTPPLLSSAFLPSWHQPVKR